LYEQGKAGASRQSLLKYVLKNFNVSEDEKVVNMHLRMALKIGLEKGLILQTSGQGASGSFKLNTQVASAGSAKATVKKPTAAAATKKPKTVAAATVMPKKGSVGSSKAKKYTVKDAAKPKTAPKKVTLAKAQATTAKVAKPKVTKAAVSKAKKK